MPGKPLIFRALLSIATISLLPFCVMAEHFTGTLTSMTQDHVDGTATESFILSDADGRDYLLSGIDRERFGNMLGRSMTVEGAESLPGVIAVQSIIEIQPRTSSQRTAMSESGLRLLVGTFDIGSNSAGTATTTQIREMLIDDSTRSLKKLLEANSYGAVTVADVSVASRVNLSVDLPSGSGNCFPWYSGTFLPAVDAALAGQGLARTSFDRVLMILPEAVGGICNFAGLAISSRDTLYSGGISTTLALHELGHNVWPGSGHGFGHASSDANNDGIIDDIYGDNFDAMGVSGYWYNFGHEEKELWWSAAGGSTRSISAPGSYLIDLPSAEFHPRDAGGSQRIRITIDGDSRPYFVTFRKMVGTVSRSYYDAFVDDHLNIHRPAVSPSPNTLILGDILEGSSYVLASPRILVEFLGQSNNIAQVRVTIGAADSDGDGVDNDLDTDDDNDGFADSVDCSPTIATRWTTRAYLDLDKDGVASSTTLVNAFFCVGSAANTGYTLTPASPPDNCPNTPNPSQADSDNDGIGDACEAGDTPEPGGPTTPDDPSNPTTPPTGSNPPPAIILTSSKIRSNVFTAFFVGVGNSAAPSLTCYVKLPGKSSFGTKNYAVTTGGETVRSDATCRVPLKKVGAYTIKLRACEGTECSVSNVRARRRK